MFKALPAQRFHTAWKVQWRCLRTCRSCILIFTIKPVNCRRSVLKRRRVTQKTRRCFALCLGHGCDGAEHSKDGDTIRRTNTGSYLKCAEVTVGFDVLLECVL